jgi:hypothetical protein
MSNRAGKRERKARNRHKRCVSYHTGPNCPGWVTVKSGAHHFLQRLERAKKVYLAREHMAAVPVADSRSDRQEAKEIPTQLPAPAPLTFLGNK